jgi:hypothetical protein
MRQLISRDSMTPRDDDDVRDFMMGVAHTPLEREPRLTDADTLWHRGLWLRRISEERRLEMILDVAEPVQIVATLAVLALIIRWVLPGS